MFGFQTTLFYIVFNSNPLRKLLRGYRNGLFGVSSLGGPFDCIDDHVEKAYFNDENVS